MSGHPAITMAVLALVGGVAGFARKRSVPSLVAGVSVAGLYYASYNQIETGGANGYEGAFASSILLLVSSLPRITKGPVPLALALTSSMTAAYYGKVLYDFR